MSSKHYWAAHYDGKINSYSKLKTFFSYSLQNFEYFELFKKYISKTDKNFIEIGCAPGSFLIKINKKFGLIPYGVEYTKNGALLTQNNLELNEINYGKIINSDVFDKVFQKKNKEKYDIVISLGFIEHFEDLKKTLEAHSNLAKKRGSIIVTLPNLKYWNKHLISKKVLDIHNLKVMDFNYIKKHLPKDTKLIHQTYYGGLFNSGAFFYNNPLLELIRKAVFIGQRLILDPIFIVLSKIGIRFKWRKTSPMMMIVLKKK